MGFNKASDLMLESPTKGLRWKLRMWVDPNETPPSSRNTSSTEPNTIGFNIGSIIVVEPIADKDSILTCIGGYEII